MTATLRVARSFQACRPGRRYGAESDTTSGSTPRGTPATVSRDTITPVASPPSLFLGLHLLVDLRTGVGLWEVIVPGVDHLPPQAAISLSCHHRVQPLR